jgi:hypothetical protein
MMSSYDNYLAGCWEDQCAREDEYSDAWHEQYDFIEKCFKDNKPITYGARQVSADNCDFYDFVAREQVEILRLMANKDDAGLLKKMKEIYEQNMESLIDLTIG